MSNEYQSRWGHHPCDQNLFCKLRQLHGWYWRTVYDFHRWHRWWRKEEQNRVGSEPTFCPAFVEDKLWRKPVRRKGEEGFKIYPKRIVDHGVLALYRSARTPLAEPPEPFDAETVQRIAALHEKTSAHFLS